MKQSPALTKLMHVLDRLFDTLDWSKKIVTDAGIEDGMIEYSTASVINWTNIVREALSQGALNRLVEAAVAEREDAGPELQALLQAHKAWVERNPISVEDLVAGMKPPTFLQIFRVAILAWIVVILVMFLAIGYVARTARYLLLGLPTPVSATLAPTEWIVGGAEVLVRIPLMIFEYAGNGYGWLRALVVMLIAGATIYVVTVKRPRRVDRFYLPRIVIPLLVLAAGVKVWHYDIPTLAFEDVLTKNSITDATFDIGPAYSREASRAWRSVVCSRIAGNDDPRAQLWCARRPAAEHRQHALGRYLMNVTWTVVISCVVIAVLRKLAHTSRQPEWNVTPTLKRMLITVAAIAGVLAILPTAQTYSRTVAPTDYDVIRPANDTEYFRICAGATCFKYLPAFAELEESPESATAPVADKEDILTACFESQLETLPVKPAL